MRRMTTRGNKAKQVAGTVAMQSTTEKSPRDEQEEDDHDEIMETLLPEGWRRVRHASGLHCFFHAQSAVVCWVQPYALTSTACLDTRRDLLDDGRGGDEDDDLSFVRKHVPPQSIFAHPNSRTTNTLDNKNTDDDDVQKTRKRQRVCEETEQVLEQYGRRRDQNTSEEQFIELPSAELPTHQHAQEQETAEQGFVIVNGFKLQDPGEKSANAFLTDYAMKSLRCVPQYFITKSNDDLENPIRCVVKIRHREYANVRCSSKTVAKQVAAEAALETLIPGFWQKVKSSRDSKASKPNSPQKIQDSNGKNGMGSNTHEKEENASTSLSFEKFKSLSIDDSRVLQACMDHCFKTPAQVLQEYQNRNRGISVNYNTVPIELNGRNAFKTIASAGSAVGEGVATTKKSAKQFAAQTLLTALHKHTTSTYFQLANMYSHNAKPAAGEMYSRSALGSSSKDKASDQSNHPFATRPGPAATSNPTNQWYPRPALDQQTYGGFNGGYGASPAPPYPWPSPYYNQFNYTPSHGNLPYTNTGHPPSWRYPDASHVHHQQDSS